MLFLGDTDGMIVRNILLWINQNTLRLHDSKDKRKFKRSADEILSSKERTGCCDSATFFVALARAKNIPCMQIITLDKSWGERVKNNEKNLATDGHFFVGCYLRDTLGNAKWNLIDTDKKVQDVRDVDIRALSLESRNITKRLYAFAYTRDYSDIVLDGKRIDSIGKMTDIQKEAYLRCNYNDMHKDESVQK